MCTTDIKRPLQPRTTCAPPSSFTLPHVLVCKEILIVVGILDYITYKFDRF